MRRSPSPGPLIDMADITTLLRSAGHDLLPARKTDAAAANFEMLAAGHPSASSSTGLPVPVSVLTIVNHDNRSY